MLPFSAGVPPLAVTSNVLPVCAQHVESISVCFTLQIGTCLSVHTRAYFCAPNCIENWGGGNTWTFRSLCNFPCKCCVVTLQAWQFTEFL